MAHENSYKCSPATTHMISFKFQKQFLSACKSGDVTLAKELLNQGVKVESMDEVCLVACEKYTKCLLSR